MTEIMTAEEVAEFLRVDVEHVQRMARKRKIPAKKVGHCWRFSRSAIEEWFNSGVNSSAEETQ